MNGMDRFRARRFRGSTGCEWKATRIGHWAGRPSSTKRSWTFPSAPWPSSSKLRSPSTIKLKSVSHAPPPPSLPSTGAFPYFLSHSLFLPHRFWFRWQSGRGSTGKGDADRGGVGGWSVVDWSLGLIVCLLGCYGNRPEGLSWNFLWFIIHLEGRFNKNWIQIGFRLNQGYFSGIKLKN